MRLEAAVRGWDVHVGRCRECLSFGQYLCPEGTFASEDVGAARSKLEAFERRERRSFLELESPAGPSRPSAPRPAPG